MKNTAAPTKAHFERQEMEGVTHADGTVTYNTDMDITRDGVLIGVNSAVWRGKFIHTTTLLDGRTGVGTSKVKSLAAAEAK